MTGGRCHRRRKMMGRGADGGCGTEEKPCPISRVPTKIPVEEPVIIEKQTPVGIDFYTQAQKVLSQRSPFDTVDAQVSTIPSLPSGLARFLSRHSDTRKRHKKSHSGVETKSSCIGGTEKGRGSNIWIETEKYFRELTVDDIGKLQELSSFVSAASQKCFSVPVLDSVLADNAGNCAVANEVNGAKANGVGSDCGVFVKEEVQEEVEQLMTFDSEGATVLLQEENGSSPSSQLVKSNSSLEWLLGSRSKIYLTSERPSKKRKLLGGDAGLEKLLVPSSVDGLSALCHYCSLGDSGDQLNRLIICSSCGVAVHQRCYGVLDDIASTWLCSWCKQRNAVQSPERPCVLCSRQGGALKPVSKRGYGNENGGSVEFAHLFCCQWMPEVYVQDPRTMEPVMNVDGIKETRRKLICYLCKVKCGACVRCSNGTCRTSFHPICAREATHRMEIWGKFGCDDVELRAFCSKHSEVQDGSSTQQLGNGPIAINPDSYITKHQPVTPAVNKPHKLRISRKNGDKIAVHTETTDKNINKLGNHVVHEGEISNAKSNSRLQLECADTQLPASIETLDKGNNDDVDASDPLDFTVILKKLIDRGKVNVEDVASDIGISPDSLASMLADDGLVPDLRGKIARWLRNHAYMGTLQKNLKVKIKSSPTSKDDFGAARDSDTVMELESDMADVVPVKSVPPRRRTKSNIRILKDNKVICSSKGTSCDDGMVIDDGKRGQLGSDSIKDSVSSISGKDLMEPNEVHDTLPSSLSNCQGSRDQEVSPPEASSSSGMCCNEGSGHCDSNNLELDGGKLGQLVKAGNTGVLEIFPKDEVEAELIYHQHQLLRNEAARKRFCDDLIQKVVKNIPHEIDAVSKQKWDAVLVTKYLSDLREAKKQGRKERRHKEAQAVLAAATAAAAASSRISSFRKDTLDESAHQENLLKVNNSTGRPGLYSQPMPRTKDTLSKMAVPQFLSEMKSDFDKSISNFSKDHPRTCDICRRSETILNPILVCSSCKVSVHLDCYRSVKGSAGPWHCELCEDFISSRSSGAPAFNSWEKPYCAAECGFCGGSAGAFRKSTDGQWVHAFCAEWVLESTFRRGQANSVEGVGSVLKGTDVCLICHSKHGVCIKCNYGHCQSTFHPTCARSAGFYMIVKPGGGRVQHKAYCEKHSLEQRAKAEKHGIEELKSLKQIRVELERLRLLCERILKREKLKRDLVVCSQDILVANRDSVALSALVRSPFFPPDVSSESATTSLRGNTDDCRSGSEAMQRSDDVTVDSSIAGKRRIRFPVSMDNDQKTDDSSTSQHLYMQKPRERVKFAGKQIPHRPSFVTSQNLSDDGEKKSKFRKHTETFEKELVMTSDQASVKNQRLPKGFVYVPIGCLSKEKETSPDAYSGKPLERDG